VLLSIIEQYNLLFTTQRRQSDCSRFYPLRLSTSGYRFDAGLEQNLAGLNAIYSLAMCRAFYVHHGRDTDSQAFPRNHAQKQLRFRKCLFYMVSRGGLEPPTRRLKVWNI